VRRLLALGVVATLAGCGERLPHTRPDEMSAQAHRREAAQHFENAHLAAARVEARDHGEGAQTGKRASYSYHWDTDRWLEQEEGEEHLGAAFALEREYQLACALVPPAEQAMSPIDGHIVGFERVDGRAVRIHLDAAAGPPAVLVHHLRCHRARMAYLGLAEMRDCPLGVHDLAVTVRATSTGVDVVLAPADRTALPELERRTRNALARRRDVTAPRLP
jgi:hypothetical protein